jgi:hypothetical protein
MSALLGIYLLKKLWIPLIKTLKDKKNKIASFILSKTNYQKSISKNFQ